MKKEKGRGVFQHMSLDLKLKLFIFSILVPLAVLIVFLLATMVRYSDQYALIVRNVITAGNFSADFKTNLDYKIYRRVVGGGRAYEEFDPSEDMEAARAVVDKLRETTTHPASLRQIRDIDHFLNNLDRYIENIRPENSYDYNVDVMWEKNVQVVTDLIQDRVHTYIYLETTNLADLQEAVSAEVRNTIYIVSLISVSLFCILWVIAIIISGSISRPIKELCNNIRMVGEGDFTVRPVASHSNEIQTLSASFEQMVTRISDLVERNKQEQINLRSTELKLLQAQINPHFLYNTFDTIIWLAEDNQTEQVKEITASLSSFFRTTLSKGQDFITLYEEELHVRSYLEIQSTRYRDILEYDISIPSDLYSYILPKLTLQPLVENALYHGIKNKRGMGKITVTAEQRGTELLLSVEDNGIGMSPGELLAQRKAIQEPQDSKKGFGIANVHERIQLYFGKEYGVKINSILNSGTIITVNLPAQLADS